jgi:hypothetical protein
MWFDLWGAEMYQPMMRITDCAEVQALLGPPMPKQVKKVIDHIDEH